MLRRNTRPLNHYLNRRSFIENESPKKCHSDIKAGGRGEWILETNLSKQWKEAEKVYEDEDMSVLETLIKEPCGSQGA